MLAEQTAKGLVERLELARLRLRLLGQIQAQHLEFARRLIRNGRADLFARLALAHAVVSALLVPAQRCCRCRLTYKAAEAPLEGQAEMEEVVCAALRSSNPLQRQLAMITSVNAGHWTTTKGTGYRVCIALEQMRCDAMRYDTYNATRCQCEDETTNYDDWVPPRSAADDKQALADRLS